MKRIIRIATPAVLVWALTASAAFAQTFNFGTGIVGSAWKARPGQLFTYGVGADLPFDERWSVRVEAARRLPDSLQRSHEPLRYPSGFRDTRATVEEHSIADVAVLLRFGSPRDRTVQFGALAGLDVQAVNVKDRAWVPHSVENPTGVLETTHEALRFDTVFDLGGDMTVRVDDRWSLTAFGIAGLQPPYNEDRRPQLRAGVFAGYRF